MKKKLLLFSLVFLFVFILAFADYNPPMISTTVPPKGLVKLDKTFTNTFDLSKTRSNIELRNIPIPSLIRYDGKDIGNSSYYRIDLTFDAYQYKFLLPYLKIDIYSTIKKSSNYYYGKKIYSGLVKVQRVNSNKYVEIIRFNSKKLIINSKTYESTLPIVFKFSLTKYVPSRFTVFSILYKLETKSVKQSKVKVNFSSNPSGAVVYLGAKMMGITPFYAYFQPGSYLVRFFKSGYPQQNVKFLASGSSVNVSANFVPKQVVKKNGTVVLSINPPDATIMFNGKLSPQNVFTLPVGTYSVGISADGYESQTFTFTVEANKKKTYYITLKQKMATLIVNANPNDSKIYIDGKFYYGNVFKLKIGIHSILVKHDSYQDRSFNVNLAPNETMKCDVALEPLKGYLAVNSNIQSKVYVNGKYVGDTNLVNYSLVPGDYTVEIINSSFDFKTKVTIQGGKTKTINLNVGIN